MFKLTKEEQWVVVFLLGVLVLGTAVRQWRTQRTGAASVAKSRIGEQ
jgi:hypothetical protein